MVESLIPSLTDDVAELCLSRVPRSSFRIISQVCWGWRRFLRSERYGAVRKLTESVEELMCVLVNDNYWEVFDGSGNKLGRIPPSPGPLTGCSGIAVLDGVYNYNAFACTSSADVYEFNPATNRWRKLADMNIPRYGFGYAVVDGLLYVVRGFTSDGVSILNSEVYNPKTNRWSLMDFPYRRSSRCAFAFSFKSKLFVVDHRSSFIHIYDPKTETWEELDSGQSLSAYSHHTCTRNKVCFFDYFNPGMVVFDPEKNPWSSVFVPPFNGHDLWSILGTLNNKVFLFSPGYECICGDIDKEDVVEWRASPIKLSGYSVRSVLINF